MIRRLIRMILFLCLALLLLACGLYVANSGRSPVTDPAPESLRLATFNVHWIALRRAEGPWSVADWERRRGPMAAAIRRIAPDLLALQEAESFPATNRDGTNLVVEHLTGSFPEFGLAASGPPDAFPPTQPILYRTDRLRLLDQGWFFFSETPDVLYARTFNGSFPAFASWAEFVPAGGGAAFQVVNIHTDFASRSNRRRSADLIRDRIAPWIADDMTVFVVGDMNAFRGSYTLRSIEEAGVAFLRVPGATVHFNRGINLFGAIDHIGHSPGPRLTDGPVVVRERFEGEWPSDHYPVFADFELE